MILIISSCGGAGVVKSEKISPQLNQKLNTALENNEFTPIQFTGRIKDEITDGIKSKLNALGITVYKVSGNVFTGMGTPHSIIKLAELEIITSLETNSYSKSE